MPIFNSTDIERFYLQGESEISTEKSFLVDRYSIPIVAGTSTYTIPDYAFSIRRITYLGWLLDPLPANLYREAFQSQPSQAQPFWYIFNNIGLSKVQLFPIPGANLAAGVNLWSTDIPTSCIVEFWRAADGATWVLPTWAKRRLLKAYVAFRAYSKDGIGNNMKLAQYYEQKWKLNKMQFASVLDYLHSISRKLVLSEGFRSLAFPGQPVLPIGQFGISVDEGY